MTIKVEVCCFFFLLAACCFASDPSAEELLQAARLRPTAHSLQLSGELRGMQEPLPLTLVIEKETLRYELHNPEETILLTLKPTSSVLSRSTADAKNSPLGDAKRYQEIRDSGITYDDLSLGFLYWPQARILKNEILRGMKVSVIELQSPSFHQLSSATQKETSSPYGRALVWIDSKNGTPLRMEGYDPQGHLLKRFEVISAQKIDTLWMLKEMRIETFDPTTQKITQRRYLDLAP